MHAPTPLQDTNQPSLAQRIAATSAAAMMTLSSFSGTAAIASEFDLLAEPAPTTSYYLDDASVLSSSTKSDVNKKLKDLEVGTANHTAALQPVRGYHTTTTLVRGDQGSLFVVPGCMPSYMRMLVPLGLQRGAAVTASSPATSPQASTGFRLEVATVRKLEYETDAFAFSEKVCVQCACACVCSRTRGDQHACLRTCTGTCLPRNSPNYNSTHSTSPFHTQILNSWCDKKDQHTHKHTHTHTRARVDPEKLVRLQGSSGQEGPGHRGDRQVSMQPYSHTRVCMRSYLLHMGICAAWALDKKGPGSLRWRPGELMSVD